MREQSAHHEDLQAQANPVIQQPADHFQRLLPKCQSLQEIRDLIHRLEIDLLHTPCHSRLILKHLLSSKPGIMEVHAFFIDTSLNPSDSGCFKDYLQWLTSNPQSKEQLDAFHACVHDNLQLGLLSGRDIQSLLANLANVNVEKHGTVTKLGETEAIQDWYWMMADAMRNCPIFSLKDLEPKHLKHWFQRVEAAPFAISAFQTFLIIQRELPGWEALKLNTVRALLKKWITHANCLQGHHPLSTTEHHQAADSNYEKVAKFLGALHPVIAVKSICQTTEKLVRDVLKTARRPGVLEIWTQTLSCLSSSMADTILHHWSFKKFVLEEASLSGFTPQEHIVIRLWTFTSLTRQASMTHHSSLLQDLTRIQLYAFEGQLKPGQDMLAELVLTLQSLPLPSPSAVLQKITRCCVGYFQFNGSIVRLQADLLNVSHSPISLFREDDIYKNAKINLKDYLRHTAERVNEDPNAFLQVALALIMRDRLSIKIITRILKHNLALNLSLSNSSRPTTLHLEQPRTTTSAAATTSLVPTTSHSLTPAIALHLLNSLARAFAISPALSPRQSFRKVYWIYLHLHRYTWGAAIGPDITRSLWHAGVTRYKETGTSPTKVGWILGKVREVEGQNVADRLLWFGAGGIKGWEEWMRKETDGTDVEGWKRISPKKKNTTTTAQLKVDDGTTAESQSPKEGQRRKCSEDGRRITNTPPIRIVS